MSTQTDRVSLAAAGLRLGRSRNQVERLVMIGALTGGRDETGRWWVDVNALRRFVSKNSAVGVGRETAEVA